MPGWTIAVFRDMVESWDPDRLESIEEGIVKSEGRENITTLLFGEGKVVDILIGKREVIRSFYSAQF